MRDYRLFVLDQAGHIAGPPAVITCESDADAVQSAHEIVDGQKTVELWQGPRLIAKIVRTHDTLAGVPLKWPSSR